MKRLIGLALVVGYAMGCGTTSQAGELLKRPRELRFIDANGVCLAVWYYQPYPFQTGVSITNVPMGACHAEEVAAVSPSDGVAGAGTLVTWTPVGDGTLWEQRGARISHIAMNGRPVGDKSRDRQLQKEPK